MSSDDDEEKIEDVGELGRDSGSLKERVKVELEVEVEVELDRGVAFVPVPEMG